MHETLIERYISEERFIDAISALAAFCGIYSHNLFDAWKDDKHYQNTMDVLAGLIKNGSVLNTVCRYQELKQASTEVKNIPFKVLAWAIYELVSIKNNPEQKIMCAYRLGLELISAGHCEERVLVQCLEEKQDG